MSIQDKVLLISIIASIIIYLLTAAACGSFVPYLWIQEAKIMLFLIAVCLILGLLFWATYNDL